MSIRKNKAWNFRYSPQESRLWAPGMWFCDPEDLQKKNTAPNSKNHNQETRKFSFHFYFSVN
jgi:hypothetical protein